MPYQSGNTGHMGRYAKNDEPTALEALGATHDAPYSEGYALNILMRQMKGELTAEEAALALGKPN